MRISCSQHQSLVDLLASDLWPEFKKENDFLVAKHLKDLFVQISERTSPIESSAAKGKKRMATSPIRQDPKRIKLSSPMEGCGRSGTVIGPILPSLSLTSPVGGEKVPVWRHVFEMRFSDVGRCGSNNPVTSELMSSIDFDSFNEPTTIDIGHCRIQDFHQNLTASWVTYPCLAVYNNWLLLPQPDNEHDHVAILRSCYELEDTRKLDIQANMKMVILPEGHYNSEDRGIPFEIQIEVLVSFRLPVLFDPMAKRTTKKRLAFVEERLCHLYQYLYGQSSYLNHFSPVNDIDIPFFYSILAAPSAPPSRMADEAMQPGALQSTLLPFQRRSVTWLLQREGKEVTPQGEIVPTTDNMEQSFWDEIQEGNHTFFYNRVTHTLSTTKPPTDVVLGGILAEEPGLGKTLETIALTLLNPAPPTRNPSVTQWDPVARLNVKEVKTTLIVTPIPLAGQWVDEIKAHAPSLKVLVYEGWAKLPVPIINTSEEQTRVKELRVQMQRAAKRKNPGSVNNNLQDDWNQVGNLDWPAYVQQFDIVITNYAVLRTDLNIARATKERPRREDVTYLNVERPRSPLVMVEWLRVVMDEVQMVGGGKAEDMVALIPRLASFAVSGTPARSQVADLIHVLKFLRVDSLVESSRMWNQLIQPNNAKEFTELFRKYTIRTVKAQVKDELTIPHQTRYMVGIKLGPIERHVYNQALEQVLNQLGLDARGVAASTGWELDASLLRASLRRLRAICTHPQVGQLQRQGDKLIKPGALKTMDAVLEDMKDKNWRGVMDEIRTKLQGLGTLAQFQQQTRVPNRYQQSLETLLVAEKEADRWIDELQATILEFNAKVNKLKEDIITSKQAEEKEKEKDNQNPENGTESMSMSMFMSTSISKDKAREKSPINKEELDREVMRNPFGEELVNKRRAIVQRLREARLVLHKIKFLQGDVYHVLGGQYGVAERDAYGVAEAIRRDLLRSAEEEANNAMIPLNEVETKDGIAADTLTIKGPFLQKGCKSERSLKLMEETHKIIEQVLNQQTTLLWQWRSRAIELLTQKLNPGEDEADGQEYQRTLDSQGEAEMYLQVYAALLADRKEALLNERTILAAHDVREKKLRHTKAAMKAAAALDEIQFEAAAMDDVEDVELLPEHEVAQKQLSLERKAILEVLNSRALRSITIDLENLAVGIKNDKDPEKIWAKTAATTIRHLIAEQNTIHEKLETDLAGMRRAFNQRIIYFRQLQEISDSVIQAEWEGSIENAVTEQIEKNRTCDANVTTGRARQRYLDNLVQNKGKMVVDDDDDNDDEDDACILCRCEFVRGFITQCAHIFCEMCMKAWLQRKEGKTCPICRIPIDPSTVERFKRFKTKSKIEPPAEHEKSKTRNPVPRSSRQILYNTINPKIYEEIQEIDAFGDYGSKVQTLVRHLLYLQEHDPGSKSIVFSAWADSLHIVQAALTHNGITCLRIDQNKTHENAAKRFRTDPEIPVLLLHGERENAGLNLTCASRVFLLESVVHHGFEIQAIARIDRLGQTRPTEVYCYYAEDTVERNILDLAARQGVSLYTKENAAGTLNISDFDLDNTKQKHIDSPKKVQKGDFIFQVDDMLAILFPHMYEDIEYLIPVEVSQAKSNTANGQSQTNAMDYEEHHNGVVRRTRAIQQNAVAGPSRLS